MRQEGKSWKGERMRMRGKNGRQWAINPDSLFGEKEKEPPPASSLYSVEDRTPYIGLHVIAVIFIQSFSWTAVMAHYLEGLTDLEVEIKGLLVFTLHCSKNSRVFPVNRGVAMLSVSCEA